MKNENLVLELEGVTGSKKTVLLTERNKCNTLIQEDDIHNVEYHPLVFLRAIIWKHASHHQREKADSRRYYWNKSALCPNPVAMADKMCRTSV